MSSTPGIFQRPVDNLLQGMIHVVAYLDDILIFGRSEQEHLDHLEPKEGKVSVHAAKRGLSGRSITKEGIKPMGRKVRAITHASTSHNIFELRSFWGLLIFTVNSYEAFLLF